MKKSLTIFALFTMIMLTSFVDPSDIGGKGLQDSKGDYTSIDNEIGGKGLQDSKGDIFNSTYTEIGGKGLQGSKGD